MYNSNEIYKDHDSAIVPIHMKPRLQWTALLFAFAANILFVTVADTLAQRSGIGPIGSLAAATVVPLIVGALTSLYAGTRGGMHAFIGGILSIPVLTFAVFNGLWQLAFFSGAFCTIGGSITELLTRRRHTIQ